MNFDPILKSFMAVYYVFIGAAENKKSHFLWISPNAFPQLTDKPSAVQTNLLFVQIDYIEYPQPITDAFSLVFYCKFYV